MVGGPITRARAVTMDALHGAGGARRDGAADAFPGAAAPGRPRAQRRAGRFGNPLAPDPAAAPARPPVRVPSDRSGQPAQPLDEGLPRIPWPPLPQVPILAAANLLYDFSTSAGIMQGSALVGRRVAGRLPAHLTRRARCAGGGA